MNKQESLIITFYSYKGGVGRSMAVANVAWLLAQKGKKVLLVDWDLEAPGLHRFFKIEETRIRTGLIDMLYDYKEILKDESGSLPNKLIDIKKYITPVKNSDTKGTISILAAGRPGKQYANRVNEFSWEEFYSKWHGSGFIEYLKEQFRKEAEITIIDSRTGVTDIGGICTLQLPDTVVLLFALNEQNIAGVESVAESIIQRASEVTKRESPPSLILRPSRVDKISEEDKKIMFEKMAASRLSIFLPDASSQDALIFMKKKSIPYIASYSFGETPLAVQKDPYGDLASSFEDLVSSLLDTGRIPNIDSKSLHNRSGFLFLKRRIFSFLTSKTFLAAVLLLMLAVLLVSYLRIRQLDKRVEELTTIELIPKPTPDQPLGTISDDVERDQMRITLSRKLFSVDPEERIETAAELVRNWNKDDKLIPVLIETANANFQNENGVFNTLVVLDAMDLGSLRQNEAILRSFLGGAGKLGKNCRDRASKIMKKLG